ncbi:calmodulin-binding transcription activator 2 isoform X1 [Brachionus plicatilis]|uniref:Calmodulin-binding transcription activator 2 isoform X1 n=1 Tax=Brachionus plicatilis TaxID=10195 RepID=A0A3M7SYY3_BRAPC|nr:calmodulin-binding transcription activator 2 isoform X1 [Brachionus plicatilis]
MTRNILPKNNDIKINENMSVSLNTEKSNIVFMNKSDNEPNTLLKSNQSLNLSVECPFSIHRLNQWHTNEEIFNILGKCKYLFANDELMRSQLSSWFTDEVVQRPSNGSVLLFDRRKVKNFKKDGFNWKRRKTGGANSVREDRMYLKINGVDCIYGCYSHSSIIPTFHRRCYWLIDKPDFVLVHYLQMPNSDTGECNINLNLNHLVNNSEDNGPNTDELKTEIKSMLWPYYLSENFLKENLKLFKQNYHSLTFKSVYDKPETFLTDFLDQIFQNDKINLTSFRVNLVGQNLNDLLEQTKFDPSESLNNQVDKNSDKIKLNVQLSMNHCFSNANKIFLIGNWSDIAIDLISRFKLFICSKEVKVEKLNSNVLECVLPNFDFIFDKNNSTSYRTTIEIYHNDSLVCDPIPFEIRKSENSTASIYKTQFQIMEKILFISKQLHIDISNLYFHDKCKSLSFEDRVSFVIEKLCAGAQLPFDIQNDLSYDHECKTILHLCAQIGSYSICEKLKNIYLSDRKNLVLKTELNLASTDLAGNTPTQLALINKNFDLAIFLYRWHFEQNLSNKNFNSWSADHDKIVESCKVNINGFLLEKIENLYGKFRTQITKLNLEQESIEKIKQQIIPFSITDQDLNSLPSPNINAVLDENFDFIENLGDLSTLLSEDNTFDEFNSDKASINIDLNNFMNFESDFPDQPLLPSCQSDDQDEKIKALADNIIAAMPHKIKSHRYSSSNLMQQKSQFFDNDAKDFLIHRNSASFDEGYEGSCSDPKFSLNSCYSSSTRSSLSPTASVSYQYDFIKHLNQELSLDDSPGDESICSGSFHIDCTPSTAEFCQYFHASTSSGYYKNAIEKGFSQLTLTDDEQRELYEAALVIQNAYRRYVMRKKKKTRLDLENSMQVTDIQCKDIKNCDKMSQIYPSSLSMSSITSDPMPKTSSNLLGQNHDEYDENVSSGGEEHRQYEAACIIQKYYRRYKQYENLHKYTEAAVKIQTKYRAYKSNSFNSSKYRASPSTIKSFNNNSIDESSISDYSNFPASEDSQTIFQTDLFNTNKLVNQKQVARKLINVRQSSRFSPASTNHQSKTSSSLNRKCSTPNLMNQFCINNQNDKSFMFFENDPTDIIDKQYTLETSEINSNPFQEMYSVDDFDFSQLNPDSHNMEQKNFPESNFWKYLTKVSDY